jgi:hypothetical protein
LSLASHPDRRAIAGGGGAIGDFLQYEKYDANVPIATLYADDKVIWKKRNPTAEDSWDMRFFRDATDVAGGAGGFVNSALFVDAVAGVGQTSNEWALRVTLDNPSNAGENSGLYVQATQRGAGSTWAETTELRSIYGAPYAALVAKEIATSANGDDPNNIRVLLDVIGARGNDNQDIPEYGTGLRVGGAWNGTAAGVESAKFKKLVHLIANWTETAIKGNHLAGIGSGLGGKVGIASFLVPDGPASANTLELHFSKTSAGEGWQHTSMLFDRVVNEVLVGRLAFHGDRSAELSTGGGTASILLRPTGGLVLPSYGANPDDLTENQVFFVAGNLRVRTGGVIKQATLTVI